MDILLAPPRSGSGAATRALRIFHSDIIKSHYVSPGPQGTLILDTGRQLKIDEISNIYYQHRPCLDCAVSFAIYDRFTDIQTIDVYRSWLNSSDGIFSIFGRVQKYWKFGVIPFNELPISNKIVLEYSSMIESTEKYIETIPEYIFEQSSLSRDEAIPLIKQKLLDAKKIKASQPAGGRCLKPQIDINPVELLDTNSMIVLNNLCSNQQIYKLEIA